jgi:hypothetical protein
LVRVVELQIDHPGHCVDVAISASGKLCAEEEKREYSKFKILILR